MRKLWVTGLVLEMVVVWVLAQGWSWAQSSPPARTPIQHVVIIWQENESFDHYFATYPRAENLLGEPPFHAARGTSAVNGLSEALRTHNPNLEQPWRISRRAAARLIASCDNDHGYTSEQKAFHAGLMDRFVQFTGPKEAGCPKNFVMGYLDGNTITAIWNYAQRFSLSDNFFEATFGPSMLGAINLISGQTAGALPRNLKGPQGNWRVLDGTMVGNPPAAFDDCVEETGTGVQFTGHNIGDLLNRHDLTWGWFAAGFTPTGKTPQGTAVCGQMHADSNGKPLQVYDDPDPFDYYRSTANPHHLPPSSIPVVGRTDQANHQYDLRMFWEAAQAGHMPAVSFLRGPEYSDSHPGYSDPLVEQKFLVETINRLQQLPEWHSMAVFVTWDDSDGWYDHVMPPMVNPSDNPAVDALLGPQELCGAHTPLGGYQGRCAHGPRIPLLIISPFARVNFVDHHLTDQTSIIRFIEDNWHLGRIGGGSLDILSGSLFGAFDFQHSHAIPVLLDPNTGILVGDHSNKLAGMLGESGAVAVCMRSHVGLRPKIADSCRTAETQIGEADGSSQRHIIQIK
jgi:phospholipase C